MITITGPHYDKTRKRWYLYWTTPRKNPDGTIQLRPNGRPVLDRHRPPYPTRAEAATDKARIEAQYEQTGSGEFLFDRAAAADYESAAKILGEVPMVEAARFWRLHHPEQPKLTMAQLYPLFLEALLKRFKRETRHTRDLKSRVGIYVKTVANRYPETVTRKGILQYIEDLKVEPRTARNHKQSICRFFNWLVGKDYITTNPAGGIKKSDLAVGPGRALPSLSRTVRPRLGSPRDRATPVRGAC
ncbi:hypothetical protein DB347_20260 [Opitutaceae bacterium EW11]|nr:hypothetical protein DB347_20260 [Opitutaceae bacterium EW11]